MGVFSIQCSVVEHKTICGNLRSICVYLRSHFPRYRRAIAHIAQSQS